MRPLGLNFMITTGCAYSSIFAAAGTAKPTVWTTCSRRLFLRAVRHMRIFQEEDALWSWLTVLARSAVSDHGRRRTRWWNFLRRWRLEGELRAIPSAPERFVPQLEEALDDNTRALLEANYYQRQSVRDLAAQHGATEKAIEGRLARARNQLTKQFAQTPTDS